MNQEIEEVLNEAVRALQDALVCLDGKVYEGEVIYDEEPYARQKKAVVHIAKVLPKK